MKNQEVTKIDKQGLEGSNHLTVEHIIRADIMKIIRTASIEDLKRAFDIDVFDPYSEESEDFIKNFTFTNAHSKDELMFLAKITASRFYNSTEIEITTTLKL